MVTIENLLSENYTKGYLDRRTTVNDQLKYSSFENNLVSISNIKLVEGDGVDDLTNSFAAAIWCTDFIMESLSYSLYDVHFDSPFQDGNFQGIFDLDNETITPTSLYYGLLFAILVGDDFPKMVIPYMSPEYSNSIKVWGFEATLKFKFLILNKDQDPSLNGTVRVQILSSKQAKATCIYMKAPSL